MSQVKLLPHQVDVMDKTRDHNRVAFYLDM